MMKRKLGRWLIARLRERPGSAAGSTRTLAQVLGGNLVDALGPAALQRIGHAELQAADAVDLDGRAFAILERADALVIGPEKEQITRLQRDHRAHPGQA